MKKGIALTPQQRRVLVLLAEGLSHEQIAEVTGVTRITVKKHLVSICEKLSRDEHFRDVIQFILLRES
jgi:DNA-binding NarL/FixJ family response regulator